MKLNEDHFEESSIIRKVESSLENNLIYGYKLLGAGGGGFFLFICNKKNHKQIQNKLKNCKRVDFKLTDMSSEIIFAD